MRRSGGSFVISFVCLFVPSLLLAFVTWSACSRIVSFELGSVPAPGSSCLSLVTASTDSSTPLWCALSLGKSHFTLTVLVNVRGDGAEYAVAECRRTTRAQRLAGGSRRLRGTVIDRGGVNLRAEESDTREPTVCFACGRHLRRDACRLKQLRA